MTSITREAQPIILVRGFGGLGVEDERRIAYQGFNDGTVYPHKRGENYIYEGLILRFMKSNWQYHDATNVVGYYESNLNHQVDIRSLEGRPHYDDLKRMQKEGYFEGDNVVVDPAMARLLLEQTTDVRRTLWVFRYYDLPRDFSGYALALKRLIAFIRSLASIKGQPETKVNIIAHSMGGLIVREALAAYKSKDDAEAAVNKVVTLGTPHKGIVFQVLEQWSGLPIDAAKELDRFNPRKQETDPEHGYRQFERYFDPKRVLCVVGTNYRTYGSHAASWMNRIFSTAGEFGMNYNRSDGLVKQDSAQLPGSPRTFVHKCHGGHDSLVTSREAFEIASRFFFGNLRVRLRLLKAKVTRELDTFGKSEIFFGVSVKPRRVDFDLLHQSPEAENCYGPFEKKDYDLSDNSPQFDWAGPKRLIWEVWLDTSAIIKDSSRSPRDMVFRLDFYVGERDLYGIGFSDNVIFRKQYYVRALMDDTGKLTDLWSHADENFAVAGFTPGPNDQRLEGDGEGWVLRVDKSEFKADLRIEIDVVPETGEPEPFKPPAELRA